MDKQSLKLGFIGFGNMAEAILKGILSNNVLAAENIVVTETSEIRLQHLRENYPVAVADGAVDLLGRVDVVLFAVKPGNMASLMADIAPKVRPGHLFLSVCAGVRTRTMEDGLRSSECPAPRVVRVMPNTPALIGAGMAGICGGAHVLDGDMELPFEIFRAVGEAVPVEETLMDSVTALTGSGPAYVFYLIESLIEGGTRLGFDREVAREMVLQMVLGSARLAKESGREPEELRRAVTSPGGTTAAGIAVLEERQVREAFQACLLAAEARGRELGGGAK